MNRSRHASLSVCVLALALGTAGCQRLAPALALPTTSFFHFEPAIDALPAAAPMQPVAKRAVPRQPDFGREKASAQAREVAQWVFASGDHGGRSVVLVDKRAARVYVFDASGRLRGAAPALLGSARGDDTAPGVGDKPLAQVQPHERTTPAGRFVAEPGVNTGGEDIVWVDYDAAVSMHRVRARVKSERRLERLASPTPADNRISFGCINLPVAFYEQVLSPAARGGTGAVVYVLPETREASQVFGFARPAALSTRLALRRVSN